ncbi:MAG: hypothetical protein J6K22_07755 [Spirochaetaceae bacterium]|nr:hypothetical protein [Spirochaetaceae bacterium]
MANATGFPSPAQGYEEKSLNFNSLIIKNPASTFTLRYEGKGIESHAVRKGDLLVIDCSVVPTKNSLVIIRTYDGFECHPITQIKNDLNAKKYFFSDTKGNEKMCSEIFGVVKTIVRLLK